MLRYRDICENAQISRALFGASGKNLQPWNMCRQATHHEGKVWQNNKQGFPKRLSPNGSKFQLLVMDCERLFKLHQYHLSCALDDRKGLDKPLVAWIEVYTSIPFLRVLKLVGAKIWVRPIGTFFADELLVKNNSMQLARFHLPDIAPFNFKYGLTILCWWFGNFFAPGKQQLSKRFHSCSPKPALTASVGAFAWEMAWLRENMSAEEGENIITVQCNHITYLGSTPHPGGQRQRKGLCIGIP